MITCTSEMSGSASRGMRLMDQMPAITSRKVPLNTRNRLRAHHSITQLITLHSSRRVDCELLAGKNKAGPVLAGSDCYLPGPARSQVAMALVHASALVGQIDAGLHRCHAHGRHGRHVERDVHLCAGDGSSVSAS